MTVRHKYVTKDIETLVVNDKLLILDGKGPMRYVDLTNNTIKVYKESKPFKYTYRFKKRLFGDNI